jgi:hypothetical protein
MVPDPDTGPADSRRAVPLPDFVIIGAQKSGTRWLRYNLGLHPEIYTAPVEPNFFIDDRSDAPPDLAWYRSHFTDWDGEPHVGEATPAYMIWHHDPARSARRMHDLIPEARPIAVLRNPIDRAYSAVVHHIRKGRLPPDADLMELARRPPDPDDRLSLITGGWYAASLEPYRRLFEDRLLVVLHDDVVADPRATYARVLHHIGADTTFAPADLDAVRFTNQADQGSGAPPPLTADERAELYEQFAPDIAALEVMLGRDLRGWSPT